jgi:hypothetical protein
LIGAEAQAIVGHSLLDPSDSFVSFNWIELKSLILAQIERWRNALHMQVERQRGGNPGGERRTGE